MWLISLVSAQQHNGVKSVITDAGRLFTTVLSPQRQMTSTQVCPGNLGNIRNFIPGVMSTSCRTWDPERAPVCLLIGVANCHLSGATARLTSVSSQHSDGRAHPHHTSTTTQHSSESHGSLHKGCRAACRYAAPSASRRSTPPRYVNRLAAQLLHQLVRMITRLHKGFWVFVVNVWSRLGCRLTRDCFSLNTAARMETDVTSYGHLRRSFYNQHAAMQSCARRRR